MNSGRLMEPWNLAGLTNLFFFFFDDEILLFHQEF